MAMPISELRHSKISEIAFSFPEFAPACKKSVHSIHSFLRYTNQTGYTHFWLFPPNIFWSTFNLCEFVSTCKKIRVLHWFALEIYGWFKNPAMWLAENILAYISGTNIFQNMKFVLEHRNKNFHYWTNSVKINDQFLQ